MVRLPNDCLNVHDLRDEIIHVRNNNSLYKQIRMVNVISRISVVTRSSNNQVQITSVCKVYSNRQI